MVSCIPCVAPCNTLVAEVFKCIAVQYSSVCFGSVVQTDSAIGICNTSSLLVMPFWNKWRV